MDDVIKLLTSTYTFDEYGNQIETFTERQVFCQVNSVGRTEYYQAAQNNLHPSYVFSISHFKDYLGERECLYTDWTGEEKRYVITRTYRTGDRIDLTAEERVKDYEVSSNANG